MASRAVAAPARLRLVRAGERVADRSHAQTRARRTTLLLLGSTGFLTAGGLIMVLSASSVSAFTQYGSSFLFFRRQLVYAALGGFALLLTSRVPYTAWKRLAAPFLLVTAVLLALVLNPRIGTEVAGSSRWLTFGPITVQPSELAKLALVAFTAAVLAKKWDRLGELAHLMVPILPVTAVVCGMVYLQPDLGTTVVLAGTTLLLLFVAGVRLRHLITASVIGGVLGMVLIMRTAYQRARLLSFLHPWADAQGAGWQLTQSLIALGSGGWFGVGLGASRQKWLYVPNAHTDFIFSILGEELGLVGEIVVLVLFGVLLSAGVGVAARAPDVFGRLLASGIVAWLGLQTIVNLGAVTGLLPITGVPLPFLSFGGSSLVVSMAAVGMLVSIGRSSAAPLRRRAAGARKGVT